MNPKHPPSPTMDHVRRQLSDPTALERFAELLVKRERWRGGWPDARRRALARISQWTSEYDAHEFPLRHQDLLAEATRSSDFTGPALAAAALAQAEPEKPGVRPVRHPRPRDRAAG